MALVCDSGHMWFVSYGKLGPSTQWTEFSKVPTLVILVAAAGQALPNPVWHRFEYVVHNSATNVLKLPLHPPLYSWQSSATAWQAKRPTQPQWGSYQDYSPAHMA